MNLLRTLIGPHLWIRLIAPLLIICAVALATWKLTVGDRVIARGDLLLYFYPLRDYASAAVREGRLPLWNPHTFMGAPFLANSQVGFFYPFNLLTAWLPTEQAVSWNIVLHLAIAGLGMYVLARRGALLGRLAACAAGLLFGLGGYLGAQVEHLNQLQALAWLPWQLLCLFSAQRGQFLRALAALSILITVQMFAGHTQSLYISLVGLGLAGLALMLASLVRRSTDRRSKGFGAFAPLIALAVSGALAALSAAVQLAPTLELAAESARAGGLPFNEVGSFSWRPWVVVRALLPTYGDPLFPEYVTYYGASGLALALLAIVAGRRIDRTALGDAPSTSRESLWVALIWVIAGFVLALGIATPLFSLLYQFMPGFNLFRAQARWLVLFAAGVSLLAGFGVHVVQADMPRRVAVRWLIAWCALVGTGIFGGWLGLRLSPEAEYRVAPAPAVIVGWLIGVSVVTAFIALTIVQAGCRRAASLLSLAMVGALAVELFIASQFQPYARASDRGAVTSLRPATAYLLAEQAAASERLEGGGDGSNQRVLALSSLLFDPGDLPEQRLIYSGQLSEDELYDRIIASKHKEVLSPNLALYYRLPGIDGYDGGLLPLRRYAQFVAQFAPIEGTPDGRLREFLTAVPDDAWLEQMATRFIIADKTLNVPIDNVFYDLQFSRLLTQAVTFPLEPFESTAVGVVLSAPAGRPGVALATARVDSAEGVSRVIELVAGETVTQPFFALQLDLGARAVPNSITITPLVPGLSVRGLASIDAQAGVFLTQLAREQRTLRLAYSGDVKIYEYVGSAPRIVLRERPGQGQFPSPALGGVRLVSDLPEHIALEVNAAHDAQLVLRDACYPGWVAQVNGEPAEIACVDILFRAVDVPAGHSRVVFTYRPQSVLWGAGLSALGLFAWLGLVVFALRRPAALSGKRSLSSVDVGNRAA
ncbi:MAG: YfhO family protein [Anaerolineae bacterium]|nr:YfhO family protein [Thermoflexales bacterium]MDW8407610.1 YfhO family protein [Anaerolineae bacterium]